jgi:hypothetical protein
MRLPAFQRVTYESITVSTAVKGFTGSKVDLNDGMGPADYALITTEGDAFRYRFDGDPSSSDGHLIPVLGVLELNNAFLVKNFRATRVTGDSTLKVTYGWTAP